MNVRLASLFAIVLFAATAAAQSGGQGLFGDLKVDEREAQGSGMATFQDLLYSEAGNVLARQTVPSNGRYRFLDLPSGRYELVVEAGTTEVAGITVFST